MTPFLLSLLLLSLIITVVIITSILIVFIVFIILCSLVLLLLQIVYCMYQILQKFDMHWHGGGPSIAMVYHPRRVSDLLYDWKSCLLCYMKDVELHCPIFFKWNKIVRVRATRWLVFQMAYLSKCRLRVGHNCALYWKFDQSLSRLPFVSPLNIIIFAHHVITAVFAFFTIESSISIIAIRIQGRRIFWFVDSFQYSNMLNSNLDCSLRCIEIHSAINRLPVD